jgi:hypothetical protein
MQEPPSFPFTLILLFSALNLSGATSNAQTPAVHGAVCHECLQIRVGPPIVARGPAPDIEDFAEIQLPGGRFRGFVAGGHTFAIDGDHPWDRGRRLDRPVK